jgi:hypothetical protein
MREWILAVLLAATPHVSDRAEPPESRQERLEVLADAMGRAVDKAVSAGAWKAPRRELGAYLLSVGTWESHWAARIHQNRCLPWECGRGRARSPWQLERSPLTADAWDRYEGADASSTRRAALAAALVLSRARHACSSPVGVFAYYHRGTCVPSPAFRRGAENRAKTFQRLMTFEPPQQ